MNALQTWRHSLELSQPVMARLIGVPLATYIKWEQETRRPAAIARAHLVMLMWLSKEFPEVFNLIRKQRGIDQ
ncbi:MAG: hypothetical protein KJO91_09950 [Gammaproteobacteria bacterium]|nr:hypothetical protein [Gammaproteobacteria bacterium]